MVDCIILDDDDDVTMTEQPLVAQQVNKSSKFEKRLISQVRKHRIIYDNKHKHFPNVAKKNLVWQQIADKLKVDVDICKSTWIELRHKYQCHVRQLRKYFLSSHKKRQQRRPSMEFETELIYLFRFIEKPKYCAIPYEIVEPPKEVEQEQEVIQIEELPPPPVDDDLILIEQPVELIVIDEDDDNKFVNKVFHVTEAMKTLVENVKKHPDLYDTTLLQFSDYSRKSFIWNSIATRMGDKATKLMKSWIVMETRFEWEISQNPQNVDVARYQSQLQKVMEYFEPYIMANPNTVYKHSYYLKQGCWYEPIECFKDIYNLIARMKRVPDIVLVTDALLKKPEKSEEFFKLWADLAENRNISVGQCETNWLIMRHFYWELMQMREQNYHLTDKWYFEIVITELYDLVQAQSKKTQAAKEKQEIASNNGVKDTRVMPMVTLHGTTVQQLNSAQQRKQTSQTAIVQPPAPAPLPIISSAISLAPQIMTGVIGGGAGANSTVGPAAGGGYGGGSLQITPINAGGPTQPQIVLQPKTQTLLITNSVHSQTNVNLPRITITNQGAPAKVPNNTTPKPNTPTPVPKQMPMPMAVAAPETQPKVTITQKRTCVPMTTNLPQSTSSNAARPVEDTAKKSKPDVNNSPLPKISGAVSLLNPNEILIELIASQNGNHLVVHGPPLSEKYNLSMPTVAKFIREVLAIPLLHNKRNNKPTLINNYWEHISKRFNLPTHICRACWNFLLENFAHFPQIAPLKELMKPFVTSLSVWTESSDLFNAFDQNALAKGWLAHISRLPEVVECIGTYPVLYKDCDKNVKNSNTHMEVLCAWRTIALRFPSINHISSIWSAFKSVFCQYMSDIEFGINNKWHINWWRVLARLKFLVEARYSTNEPFYYIVSNKMVEEIERCAMIEMKKRYCKDQPDTEDDSKAMKYSFSDDVMMSGVRHNVDLVALLCAIEKYPIIYEKGDCMQKYEAWNSVAKELQMNVTDCLLAFRRACQKYCIYKRQDTVSRCVLNQKYYKRFDAIFRSVKPSARNKLNIKTPFELNQSVDDDRGTSSTSSSQATLNSVEDLVFPERYISDISMSNCENDLVVKNWIFAIGNLPTSYNEALHIKLRNILNTYLPPTKSKTKKID